MDEYADVRTLWASQYRVLAIDFLGLGGFDPPPHMHAALAIISPAGSPGPSPGASDDLDYFNMEPLSIEQHASYIREVCDHLSVTKATVIGNLFGSFVAAHLVSTDQDRFTSLVLVHPLLHTPEGFEKYKGWVTKFKDPASPAHQVKEDGGHWEAVWKRRTSRPSPTPQVVAVGCPP